MAEAVHWVIKGSKAIKGTGQRPVSSHIHPVMFIVNLWEMRKRLAHLTVFFEVWIRQISIITWQCYSALLQLREANQRDGLLLQILTQILFTSFHIYVFHPVIRWSCIKSLLDTDCLLARTPQRSYVQIKYWGFRSYGPLKHLVLHWWLPRWFASFRLESGLGKWSRARRRVAKHVSPCDHFGLGLELLFVVSWPLLAEVEPTFPCDFYPWREKVFVKCVDEQHKMGWWRRFINDIVFQDFSAQTPLRGFLSNMFENHHHNNPRAQAKGSKDHNTKKVKLLDIHSNPPNGPSQRGARIPLRSAGGT